MYRPQQSRLTTYIRGELQKGFSKEQIKAKLLSSGWKEDRIKKEFAQLRY